MTNYMGAEATVYDEIDTSVTTEFTGYDRLSDTSAVAVLTTEKEIVTSLMEGQKGTIFVEKTPFYATMGGQEGDTGVITGANGTFRVEDTIKLRGGEYGHVGTMISGMITKGEEVKLEVAGEERNATCKNSQRYPSFTESSEDCSGRSCGTERFSGNAYSSSF